MNKNEDSTIKISKEIVKLENDLKNILTKMALHDTGRTIEMVKDDIDEYNRIDEILNTYYQKRSKKKKLIKK